MRQNKANGFTLIELMVTIVILAILTTAGLPSFQSFITGQRVKSASFDIMSSLIFARSEAIKRNANVTITPSNNNWQYGWTVNAGATTLNTQSALGNGLNISCYANGTAVTPCPTLTYNNNGRLAGFSAPAIQLSSANGNNASTRCINVDLSGRPSSKKGGC